MSRVLIVHGGAGGPVRAVAIALGDALAATGVDAAVATVETAMRLDRSRYDRVAIAVRADARRGRRLPIDVLVDGAPAATVTVSAPREGGFLVDSDALVGAARAIARDLPGGAGSVRLLEEARDDGTLVGYGVVVAISAVFAPLAALVASIASAAAYFARPRGVSPLRAAALFATLVALVAAIFLRSPTAATLTSALALAGAWSAGRRAAATSAVPAPRPAHVAA